MLILYPRSKAKRAELESRQRLQNRQLYSVSGAPLFFLIMLITVYGSVWLVLFPGGDHVEELSWTSSQVLVDFVREPYLVYPATTAGLWAVGITLFAVGMGCNVLIVGPIAYCQWIRIKHVEEPTERYTSLCKLLFIATVLFIFFDMSIALFPESLIKLGIAVPPESLGIDVEAMRAE